jgi:threonine dehydratase
MTDLEVWHTWIEAAAARLTGQVLRTELRPAKGLSARAGVPVWLKLENRQTTGSFKLRGATNAVALLTEAERTQGLVTASTGNHGRALAHAARAAGTRCTVFLSELVPSNKRDALLGEGAEIRIVGRSQDEAEAAAREAANAEDRHFVPPFDDPAVIAGQGTIGAEILADLPETELVLVPLSGGGLAGGIVAAVKARQPSTRVIGVSMVSGAAMHASLRAGHIVEVEETPTLADSLGGGLRFDNRYTFALARTLLDDAVLVSEEEIAAGIRAAAAEGEVVEGGGAVGLGALLAGKVSVRGPVAVVLSGRNIDPARHQRIVAGEIS